MKSSVWYCLIACCTALALNSVPAVAAENSAGTPAASMTFGGASSVALGFSDGNGMKDHGVESFSSLAGDAGDTQSTSEQHWLLASVAEPFYLSLLGIALLVLGTVRSTRHS